MTSTTDELMTEALNEFMEGVVALADAYGIAAFTAVAVVSHKDGYRLKAEAASSIPESDPSLELVFKGIADSSQTMLDRLAKKATKAQMLN